MSQIILVIFLIHKYTSLVKSTIIDMTKVFITIHKLVLSLYVDVPMVVHTVSIRYMFGF